MALRTDYLLRERRKIIFLVFLVILEMYAKPIQEQLMAVRFENSAIDLAYVLGVSYFPSFLYSAIAFTLFSLALNIVKMQVLPTRTLEKKYFGLKRTHLRTILIFSAIVVLVIYDPDRLYLDKPVPSIPLNTILSAGAFGSWSIPIYLVTLVIFLPLYILSPLKIFSVIAGTLYALFLIHILSIRIIQNKAEILRTSTPQIAQEGEWVSSATTIKSLLPVLSYVSFSHGFRKDGVVEKQGGEKEEDLIGLKQGIETKYKLRNGYYSPDIVEFRVLTPPFFSKIYRATAGSAGVTVIPRTANKLTFASAPLFIDERGSIIARKIPGSSSDFSGIKEYAPGDQLSRVWWMGFAKSGHLLTKTFYSTGEDNITLMPDLSNPKTEQRYGGALTIAMTNLVNLSSRKDITLSIYPLCNYKIFAEATRSKKELLFFLMNLNAISLVSSEGADEILKSALPKKDYSLLKERCKRNNITLSSLLWASGFYKKHVPVFSWTRKSVLSESMKHFFKHKTKRSKIILLTDAGMPLESMEDFKKMCNIRKFRYLAVVLGENDKKHMDAVDEMKKRRICAFAMSYEDAEKVSKIYSLVGAKLL